MLKLIRNVLLCAVVAPLIAVFTADSADAQQRRRARDYRSAHTQYWDGYWGWYDQSYRPYWNQRYRTYNRGYNRRGDSYGYGRFDRGFYGPRRGGAVNIGPLQFGYTEWY